MRALIAIAAIAALPFAIAPKPFAAECAEQVGAGHAAVQVGDGWVVEGRASAHRHTVHPRLPLAQPVALPALPAAVRAIQTRAYDLRSPGPSIADRPRVTTMPASGPPAARWIPTASV